MKNILEKIIQEKKETLKLIKKDNSLSFLEDKIKTINTFFNFKEAINNNRKVSLISEIKKASPSAGILVKDFNHLEEDNLSYVKSKLRHAKSGFYIPPSTNYDVITYGIHGGAEWAGGTLYKDDNSTNLIIPSNNYPWIIRVNYQEKIYLD